MGEKQLTPVVEYALRVIEGPQAGERFVLLNAQSTIGRGLQNAVILQDPRASREHASLEMTPKGLMVKKLSSQPLLVNGVQTNGGLLGHGAIVTIGDTHMQFEFTTSASAPATSQSLKVQTAAPGALTPPSARVAVSQQPAVSASPYQSKVSFDPSTSPTANAGKRNFYILVAVIVLVGGWLFTDNAAKKKEGVKLGNEERSLEEVKSIQERAQKMLEQKTRAGRDTEQYQMAQSAYVRGLRDYREGNYKRAIGSFDAALALYIEHQLARRYKELARVKLDQQIQSAILEARKQYESQHYKAAIGSYRQALPLVDDKNSATFKEATARIREIELILEGGSQ
ncbi:MAG: FHA domain-containing protein [Bdellovibrionales bacterium]|nr:FHA domain-containing protein [Bdellovibrionales bacterium]